MIHLNPFILLIFYLLLAAGALWALGLAISQTEMPATPRIIILVIGGFLLIIAAFAMSGIPLFS